MGMQGIFTELRRFRAKPELPQSPTCLPSPTDCLPLRSSAERAAQQLELSSQFGAVEVAVGWGKKPFVGTGQDRGDFLQAQQARVERVDETLHCISDVVAKEVLPVCEDGAFLGPGNDTLNVAAGERPRTEFLPD